MLARLNVTDVLTVTATNAADVNSLAAVKSTAYKLADSYTNLTTYTGTTAEKAAMATMVGAASVVIRAAAEGAIKAHLAVQDRHIFKAVGAKHGAIAADGTNPAGLGVNGESSGCGSGRDGGIDRLCGAAAFPGTFEKRDKAPSGMT